jgi:hypothetical protein
MVSSGVGKSLLCVRSISILAECDGNDVNIHMRKVQSVISSSVWVSCVWYLLCLGK